ncbi:hypothetical protein GCM10027615_73840 [Plantactinospora veratri]
MSGTSADVRGILSAAVALVQPNAHRSALIGVRVRTSCGWSAAVDPRRLPQEFRWIVPSVPLAGGAVSPLAGGAVSLCPHTTGEPVRPVIVERHPAQYPKIIL